MTKPSHTMNFYVRLATADDAEALIDSAEAMMFETEGVKLEREIVERGVKTALQGSGLGFYVVTVTEKENTIVASLYITKTWMDLKCGFYWWIHCVHVRDEFRRNGIYEKMYAFVKAEGAKDPSTRGFRLCVHKDNKQAINAYKKTGMNELPYLVFHEPA